MYYFACANLRRNTSAAKILPVLRASPKIKDVTVITQCMERIKLI